MQVIAAIVLSAVTVLFVLRGAYAARNKRARPSWIATGCAVVGLVAFGVLWPATTVDRALLGGQNLLNLVLALSATAGFWFVRDAMRNYGRTYAPGRLWILAIHAALLSGLFFTIPDRQGSNDSFIDDHLHSLACWIYMTVYMAGILGLSVDSIRAVWARRSLLNSRVFIAGFVLIITAAVADLIYSLIGHIAGQLTPAGRVFYIGFELFFYGGTVVVLAGYALSWWTRSVWRLHGWTLARMRGEKAGFALARRWVRVPDPQDVAYAELVAVQNTILMDKIRLNPRQYTRLGKIQRHLDATAPVELAFGRMASA
jgi:hypothetical protein